MAETETEQAMQAGAARSKVQINLPQGDLGDIEVQPVGVVDNQIMPEAEADKAAIAKFESALPADHPYLDGTIAEEDLQVLADTGSREAQNALMIRKQLGNANERNQTEIVPNEYGAAEVRPITPSFEATPNGAIKLTGASEATKQELKANGIKFVARKDGDILVSKRHTAAAMDVLGIDSSNEVVPEVAPVTVEPAIEAVKPQPAPKAQPAPQRVSVYTKMGGYVIGKTGNATTPFNSAEEAMAAVNGSNEYQAVAHPDDSSKFALRGVKSIRAEATQKAEAEVKKKNEAKVNQKRSTTLLGRIREAGRIAIRQVRDVTNESNVRDVGVVGIFSENGRDIADIAHELNAEFGLQYSDVEGFKALIKKARNGEKVYTVKKQNEIYEKEQAKAENEQAKIDKAAANTPEQPIMVREKADEAQKSETSIGDRLRNLFHKAKEEGRSGNKLFEDISPVGRQVAEAVKSILGVDAAGFIHGIDESAIRHIDGKHGRGNEKGKDQIPVTADDVALIPEIVSNPDEIKQGKRKDGSPHPNRIELIKRIGDIYYYVEEVRQGRKKLSTVSMWKKKAGSSTLSVDKSPAADSEPTSHTPTIAQAKDSDKQDSGVDDLATEYKRLHDITRYKYNSGMSRTEALAKANGDKHPKPFKNMGHIVKRIESIKKEIAALKEAPRETAVKRTKNVPQEQKEGFHAEKEDVKNEFQDTGKIGGAKEVSPRDNSDVPFKREKSIVVASAEKLSMVSRVVERFKGRVILLSTFEDAPAAVQNKADKEGHDGSDVDGVYHNGKVYLFQDALARHSDIEAKVEEAVLHEETHAGLRKMFGRKLITKMNDLFLAIGGYKGMRAIADKNGVDLKAYMEANHIAELDADTRSAFMMDELLAHLGHEKPSIAKRAKEIIGMIRQWVRSKGLLKLTKYNDADLLHLTVTARKAKGEVKDGDVSFIRRNTEKKDLYVTHNLTAENLAHAEKMGGIAVPSLAVNKVGTGALTGFGEISLVSGSDMINNKTAKTFNADVYSPRYPDVQRVIKQEDYQQEFGRDNELADKYGFAHLDKDGMETGRFSPDVKASTAMLAYLESLGKAPRVKMTQDDIAPGMRKFVGRDQYELSRDHDFAEAIVAENRAKRQKYVESGKLTQEKADRLWGDKPSESMLYNRAGAISRLHKGKYPDSHANREAVDKKFNSLSKKSKDGYTDWLSSRIERATDKEQIFNGFTNSGSRKYLPHDLDTVVRIMKRNLRDGEGFNYGLGSIRSTVANQFRSIKAIQNARGDIISSEKMDAVKTEIETEYEDVKAKLEPYDTVYTGDIFDDSLKEIATNGASSFNDYYPNLPDSVRHSVVSFLGKLRNMPTEYFESKVQRAVGIGEFSGAAVPKDASKKTIETLKENGLDIGYYKPNDAESREKAIEKLSKKRGLLFSKGSATTGQTVAQTEKSIIKLFGSAMKRAMAKGNLVVHRTAMDAPEGVKRSFIGEKALSWDATAIKEAEALEKDGVDRLGIWKQTGSFRGVDEEWRQEIDDSQALLNKPFPSKGQKWGDIHNDRLKHGKFDTVSDIISLPAIFKAYPDIANISVGSRKGSGGGYANRNGSEPRKIVIGEDESMSNVTSILLHEIQHAIQSLEGKFAKGGSLESAASYIIEDIDTKLAALNKDIRAGSKELPTLQGDGYAKALKERGLMVRQRDELDMAKVEMQENKAPALRAYLRLAGEVEARNTQERMKISPSKKVRDFLPPWETQDTKDEDQTIRFSKDGAIQGWYADGVTHIVAENNDDSTLEGTVLHEILHDFFDANSKAKDNAISQIQKMRKVAGKRGKVFDWLAAADARAEAAETKPEDFNEEALAYTVTNYEAAPNAFKRIVDRMIGELRAFVIRHFGADMKINPETLRALARQNIGAMGKREGVFGGEGAYASIANSELIEKASPERGAKNFKEALEGAEEFVSLQLSNLDTGVKAVVSRNNLRKMLSNSAARKSTSSEDHALAVANLDKLYRNSVLDHAHEDNRGEPTIKQIQRFVAPMINSNGDVVAVKMTVKETTSDNNPNPLYTVETIEVKEKPTLDASQSEIGRVTDDRNTPQVGFSDRVRELLENVKETVGGDDIRYSKAPPRKYTAEQAKDKSDALGMPEESTAERWQRYFQDGFNRVKKVQDHLANVDESNDVYAAEERSSGIIAARLDDLDADHVKPLLDGMQKAGISLDVLDEYLLAKHAQERNEYIAGINPDMQDSGSGMATKKAKAVLKSYDKATLAQLESLADKVYVINKQHVNDMLEGHLIDAQTADLYDVRPLTNNSPSVIQ